MLDRGMLITEDDLDFLADKSMSLVKAWHRSPVVVGIDPARVKDSTVVTVMWVDWDFPDPAGYREHRILNWLEIHNTAWEEQYWEIMDFLEPYKSPTSASMPRAWVQRWPTACSVCSGSAAR